MTAPAGGRFITLEGIEGAGKSTVAHHVTRWLAARGIKARTDARAGRHTAVRTRARHCSRARRELLTPVTETLLMFAARGIHVDNFIRPALARGEWVVCDRFTDATRAYQAAGAG